MKYLGILLVGALAAACSSNNNAPPAASADSIDAATSKPSNNPDFAPVANDGTASAAPAPGSLVGTQAASRTQATAPSTATATDATTEPARAPSTGNAQGLPTQDPAVKPDNTKVNERDRSASALTPMDQGSSEGDRKITQQIRQAVMKDGGLSFTAKNVKIITIGGKVTLRGPVNTDAERASIESAAKAVAGVAQVDNQIEVKRN